MLNKILPKNTIDQNLISCLRIIRSNNIGPVTFKKLINIFPSYDEIIKNAPEMAKKAGKKNLEFISTDIIEKEIEQTFKYGAEFISHDSKEYPSLLKEIHDSPPVLIVKGDKSLLNKESLAIVGSRNASLNGIAFTKKIAAEVGVKGYNIVSGLARGIDSAAHQASIATGTIAVIAGGINHIYPEENTDLYNKIADKGLVVTEYGFDFTPQARNFPQRNRIISGLSKATLIVEASYKSGSLITASYANDQGREVMAIPGFPLDPRCQGPNKLIKDGAYLVESSADLISHLETLPSKLNVLNDNHNNFMSKITRYSEVDTKEARDIVLKSLGFTAVSVDDIIKEFDIPVTLMYLAMLELELAGKIARVSKDKFVLNIEEND